MSDFYNPMLERRRVWECSRNHGTVLIVGLEDDLHQDCPVCSARISKSRPVDIVAVLSCPTPFRYATLLPFRPE